MADTTSGLLGTLDAGLRAARVTVKVRAYEGFGRDRWQRPDDVVERLGIRPGDTIADLGAGGGYFTLRLARATGPLGRVYAVESDADMVHYLRALLGRERIANVEVVEASAASSRLPDDGVDVVFTCDAYHHFSDRVAYFARLRRALRPGGRLAVIDHDGTTGIVARWFGHATPLAVMRDELAAAGYRVIETHGGLPGQSFLILSVS